MRKTVKILGILMVVLLAVGLILPSVSAYKPGSQVGAEVDQVQGEPNIPSPGPGETNVEHNEAGGGANIIQQNSEGAGLGERTGF